MGLESIRVLPAEALQKYSRFEPAMLADSRPWSGAEFQMVFFISHRWAQPDEADASGRQLACVREFLAALRSALLALATDSDEGRRIHLPSLRNAPVLQAAYVASRLVADNGEAVSVDQVGIWYDCACLPQHPRSEEDETIFREGLLALPDVLQHPSVCVLALREAGDAFSERGWCAVETNGSRNETLSLTLRMDLINQPLPLLPVDPEEHSDVQTLRRTFQACLGSWEDAEHQPPQDMLTTLRNAILIPSLRESAVLKPDADVGHFVNERDPRPALRIFASIIHRAAVHSEAFDLAEFLAGELNAAGFVCSQEDDRPRIACLLLLTSFSDKAGARQLFEECLNRCIQGMRCTVELEMKMQQGKIFSDGLMWRWI